VLLSQHSKRTKTETHQLTASKKRREVSTKVRRPFAACLAGCVGVVLLFVSSSPHHRLHRYSLLSPTHFALLANRGILYSLRNGGDSDYATVGSRALEHPFTLGQTATERFVHLSSWAAKWHLLVPNRHLSMLQQATFVFDLQKRVRTALTKAVATPKSLLL